MEMYRQGDLLFIRLAEGEELPEGVRQNMSEQANIIAYGETTGHGHGLVAVAEAEDGAPTFEVFDIQEAAGRIVEKAFIRVNATTELVHQEHNTVTFDPGVYRVVRQEEYVEPNVSRWVND